ncbi:hypothetical protein KKA33_03505 [Patescibacteria group bacterium]|nr:hypothetical protein [Patescibacteria group bacterium]
MLTIKRLLRFALIPILLINLFIPQLTFAEDIYSPDNANRPDPLQAAKHLQRNVQVGEFSGAALYDYPIALPADRNGLTPSVQLTYNSQDSSLDNLVGYRWNLNLYSIKRFNQKGVENLYNRNDFVANTPAGGGELIATQLTNGHLGQYRQKVEGSFARYEYREDGSWLVTDKQGTQYLFGQTEEGRQFDPDDSSHVHQWMLQEIRDRNDNFVRYTYFKTDNQLYPKTIRYTGHGNEDGIFEVRFLPFANDETGSPRTDEHFGFDKGFRVDTNYLITGIEIYADNQLRREYDITHTTVDPLVKQTIGSITETGYSLTGQTTTLPPTTFEYTPSNVRWEETDDYLPNWFFETCYYECEGAKNVYSWDMTGDGLVDFEYYGAPNGGNYQRIRAVNNGQGGWDYGEAGYIGNSPIYEGGVPNMSTKAIDFNNDLRPDIVQSYEMWNADRTQILIGSQIRLESGQTFNNAIDIAMGAISAGSLDNGASIADLNGDGLPDMIRSRTYYQATPTNQTCLNNEGNSCELTDLWEAPGAIIVDDEHNQMPRQAYVQDCNHDGLADMYSFGYWGTGVWANDGKGGWINNVPGECRFSTMDDNVRRSLDANGDGLMDYVESYRTITYSGLYDTNLLHINTGNRNQDYTNLFPINFGQTGGSYNRDMGVRLVDLNGDLLPDIIQSLKTTTIENNPVITITKKVYMNRGSRPYFLKTVHTSQGGQVDLEYKTSAQYIRDDGTQANPDLPIITTTVSKMTVHDGMGNVSPVEYFYEDGHYHYNSVDDREMAGFRVVTKTDALGYQTKTYYHQGENSVADTVNGEWNDHISKKGTPYRAEIYDEQGRLVRATISRYEKQNLVYGRTYPYLKRTVAVDYNPENGSNRATAKAFEYDAYGNPTLMTDYGEVQLSSNAGEFSDVGMDLIRQENTFIYNTTDHLTGFPSEQKTFNQNAQLLAHQRTYYDELALGEISKGNPTKSENWWDTENRFVASTAEYDDYGMVIRQTNPRSYTGTVSYDANHLFPANQTNALGHTVTTDYDVAGNLLQSTDPNGAMMQNTYDGLGRLIKTEGTNPATGGLDTLKTVIYNDYSLPRSAHETVHNDDGIQVDNYTYADGLGRAIENKSEGSNGQWTTTMTLFDERGNVKKSIQAYFSQSPGFEYLDENRIGTSFTYDVLGRALTTVNPLGTTMTDYGLWEIAVTDPNGQSKDFEYDARGRLIGVTEHNGAENYQTAYQYDAPGNLIKIADALGYVRDFTYDNFGQRLTQTDAHQPGQNHGLWQYEYDDNGNLSQRTDALGQTVQFVYDALDRMNQEDFLDEPGAELTFVYDQGQSAIGRLSTVNGQNYQHNFEYDLLGRVFRDQKIIDGRDFTFAYNYDLMGGVTQMTYPDEMTVNYDYNNVHQLSRVYADGKTFVDQFDYTPLGQLAQLTLGNQVVTTNTYEPNEMWRLKEKQSLRYGVERLQDFQYTYDAMGNLMELIDESNGSTAKNVNYLYDDLYRLTEARYTNLGNGEPNLTMNYQYNTIGNMVYKSDVGTLEYLHHNPHAVTKAGAQTYVYDLAGNMTDHDGDALNYDYRGRMVQSGDGTTYTYDEAGDRIKKDDKYYPNKYYEVDGNKESKFVFAGALKIAKVVRVLITPPTVEPVVEPVEEPSYTFRGTKEAGLALWVNGVEILPAGDETIWEWTTDLMLGDNVFEFFTKQDADTASKRVAQTIHYEIPTPTVEPVNSPVTTTRLILRGTKRANTSIWINGGEAVPLNDQTNWEYEAVLQATQNPFEIHAEDRLNQASDSVQFTVAYVAQAPTVDNFNQPATSNPLTIQGTKGADMNLWINGNEVISIDNQTRWQTDLRLQKGVNTFTITSKNEFGVESTGVVLTIPYNINAPTVDPVQSPTSNAMVTLIGTKRAYTSLWINGKETVPINADEFWAYTVTLTGLHNEFTLFTKDEEGLESDSIMVAIDYEAAPPTVDPVSSPTSTNPYPFSGTKPAGTGIWVNGNEVVPADETTVWVAYVPLMAGGNHFDITTKSPFGIESTPVGIDLTYNPPPANQTNTPAQNAGGMVTSSGGGGATDITLNTMLFRRLEEKEAQEAELEAKEEGVDVAELDLEDPNVLADLILYSQSADRTTMPKTVWPIAESKTGVEFKNLQIVYHDNKALIKWDTMTKEVAMFDIYRSKYPYPDRRSKHASQKIATLEPQRFKNRYQDIDVQNGDRYTYRITALNHNGDIIATSIQLTPEQIFIAKNFGSKVDFSSFTDKEFDSIYIAKHNHLEFEETGDLEKRYIKPKNGFSAGTKIQVRFIGCQPKENGGDYCQKVDQKIIDVYTVQKPKIATRVKRIGKAIIDFLIPSAHAAGVQEEEKVYYYLQDHLGGVDVVTDENGDVVQRKDYLPFGSERLAMGSSDEDYGFTGKELDEETGLYYYGARYYDPEIGRFVSLDPLVLGEAKKSKKNIENIIRDPQMLNGYAYAKNNPLKYVDPTGEKSTPIQKLGRGILKYLTNRNEEFKNAVKSLTNVVVTRGVYKGTDIKDELYYKDNLSVKVGPFELNNIEVQSTVDSPGTKKSWTKSDGSSYNAKIGASGATKDFIDDTLQIEGAYFLHETNSRSGKPYSQGCTVTKTDDDNREVMDILRGDLHFENGETVKYSFEAAPQPEKDENKTED